MFADVSVSPQPLDYLERFSALTHSVNIELPAMNKLFPNFENSQINYTKKVLLESLANVAKQASVFNWDDEGGIPVNRSSLEFAKIFLSYYPHDLMMPSLYPDPDGSIGMDWDFSDGTNLIATIMPSGEIAYSVYGDSEKTYGSIIWNKTSFPIQLRNIIKTYE
ncbi:hypothetical protein [Leptospira sp. GIMC2001]|uniref:hypothetical protein n=1 Tax=Leptospira sp. GIMC2001 TaxID=1513297 RepID=UPI00234AFBE9|nr:hypothetical protein [Leptospira sp. GIMC2001]WCL50754.1 hypothetical protein O4O04_08060 [Leptospira sp. GIMC2001]